MNLLTYERFLSTVAQDESGEFIADGDTLFVDEAELRAFYASNVAVAPPDVRSENLTIMTAKGVDVKWSTRQRKNLTYCVSTTFGKQHPDVVAAMEDAASAWEDVAGLAFHHDATLDPKCTASTKEVVFDVNPVNAHGDYLARAFFPNTTRASRNVRIDPSAFATSGKLTLTGILRHELGHTIGFRHEHTRPEAGGKCFEDRNWRGLTPYDAASVMHYPQCNGSGDWSLELTERDARGAALAYPK